MRQRDQIIDSNHSGKPPFPIKEPLLTQTEAANLLHVEPRTLESWRQHRIGPCYIRYSRRCVRYRLQDLSAWVSEQAVETAPQNPTRQ
jgi:hypothetical protein